MLTVVLEQAHHAARQKFCTLEIRALTATTPPVAMESCPPGATSHYAHARHRCAMLSAHLAAQPERGLSCRNRSG